MKPFRFGVQAGTCKTKAKWTEIARKLKILINAKHTVIRFELDNHLVDEAVNSFQLRERLA